MKNFKLLLLGVILCCTAIACNKNNVREMLYGEVSLYHEKIYMANNYSESRVIFSAIEKSTSKALKDSVNTWISYALNNAFDCYQENDSVNLFKGSMDSLSQMANHYAECRLVKNLDEDEIKFLQDINIQYSSFDSVKIFTNKGLTSVVVFTQIFRGGPHGYTTQQSAVFDNQSGHAYTLSEMFKDKVELNQLIINGLKHYFKVSSDEELKASLGNIDNLNKIPLPQMMPYFSDEGLVICYNSDEIAPHAAGSPKIVLSYKDCKKIVNKDILKKVKLSNKQPKQPTIYD